MNKSNKNFAVLVPSIYEDPNQETVELFFTILQNKYPQLTICGLEEYDKYYVEEEHSVEYIRPGSVIEISNERDYNVDWFGTKVDAMMNGVMPTLNLLHDFKEVINKVDEFARVNYPMAYVSMVPANTYAPGFTCAILMEKQNKTTGVQTFEVPGFPTIKVTDLLIQVGNKFYNRVVSAKADKKYMKDTTYAKVYTYLKAQDIIVIK